MIFCGRARFGLLLLCAASFGACGSDNDGPNPLVSPSGGGNPTVSQGGRIVVFESASSLVVVDRVNATSLVIGENDGVANSVVTPDGRFVAFDAIPAGMSTRQVFLRDLTTGETTLVSAASGDVPGAGNSTHPSLSDDGRFVAFQSDAVDLGARPGSSSTVLVRDVPGETIQPAGAFSGGDDLHPAISGNGQFVAFESRPPAGLPQVLLSNRLNGQVTPVSGLESAPPPNGPSGEPSLSFDGRFVAFESRATNLAPSSPETAAFAGQSNIVVRDVLTGALAAASVPLDPGTAADGDSRNPTISRDGRRVAFDSTATNLTPDVVQPGVANVFVRDLSTDTTTLVTRPEPVPAPEPPAPAPSGLTTSTPVLPVVPIGTPTPPATAPPEPVGPVPTPTPPAQPVPVPGGLSTSAPVSGLSTSTPVSGLSTSTPVTGLSTGTPLSGLSTSTPVTGMSAGTPVSGLSTSTPVSGLVTSTPVGTFGSTETGTGVTVELSVAPAESRRPSISPDGAWVAFESRGGIFLADLQTRTITPIRRTK